MAPRILGRKRRDRRSKVHANGGMPRNRIGAAKPSPAGFRLLRFDQRRGDVSPAAYKDIGAVMKAQEDLIVIRHRLRQVVNVKG